MIRLLLFVVTPLVEMALLLWAANNIGFGPTLVIVILTGFVGASLVKRQGLAVWQSARERLSMGAIPSDQLAHGAMLLLAGAFLITPGFLTDITGFALLLPPVREWARRVVGDRLRRGPGSTSRVEVWRV